MLSASVTQKHAKRHPPNPPNSWGQRNCSSCWWPVAGGWGWGAASKPSSPKSGLLLMGGRRDTHRCQSGNRSHRQDTKELGERQANLSLKKEPTLSAEGGRVASCVGLLRIQISFFTSQIHPESIMSLTHRKATGDKRGPAALPLPPQRSWLCPIFPWGPCRALRPFQNIDVQNPAHGEEKKGGRQRAEESPDWSSVYFPPHRRTGGSTRGPRHEEAVGEQAVRLSFLYQTVHKTWLKIPKARIWWFSSSSSYKIFSIDLPTMGAHLIMNP